MKLDAYISSPIFVTGLPRSGTSMVAGCLHRCGFWVGDTVPGGIGNPRGFYENTKIRETIIKPILVALGCDPLGVKKLPQFKGEPRANGLVDAIQLILQKEGYKQNQQWLYKDAKLSLLWPYFINAFPNARWVIVKRNPEHVIDSCLHTHFMAHHSKSRLFWHTFVREYQQRLNQLKHSGAQVYSISADKLIRGKYSGLQRLTQELGVEYNHSRIQEFISPNLWQRRPEVYSHLDYERGDDSIIGTGLTQKRGDPPLAKRDRC